MLDLDNGHPTTAVFLYIKEAFDIIDNNILINILKHSGVGDNAIVLFTDYLKNRKQAVLYNSILSDTKTLTTGVHKVLLWDHSYFLIMSMISLMYWVMHKV